MWVEAKKPGLNRRDHGRNQLGVGGVRGTNPKAHTHKGSKNHFDKYPNPVGKRSPNFLTGTYK